MIRKFLTTTAFAALVATGPFVYGASAQTLVDAPASAENGITSQTIVKPVGRLASNILGATVYNGAGADAKDIGKVNDLVIAPDGKIDRLVIGVGGFLGLGEKNVAIAYSDAEWTERNGNQDLVIATTADALKSLPDFDRHVFDAAAASGPSMVTVPKSGPEQSATKTLSQTGEALQHSMSELGEGAKAALSDGVDRSTLEAVGAEPTWTANQLEGTNVYGADDKRLGDVIDVILTQEGKVDALVVDVGGFLGIGAKPVAVAMDSLDMMQDKNGRKYIFTPFTKEQLEAQPAYDAGKWATNRDEMLILIPN